MWGLNKPNVFRLFLKKNIQTFIAKNSENLEKPESLYQQMKTYV